MTVKPLFSHAGHEWDPTASATQLATAPPPAPTPTKTAPAKMTQPQPRPQPRKSAPARPRERVPASAEALADWLAERCPAGQVIVTMAGEDEALCDWGATSRAITMRRPSGAVTALAIMGGTWAATGGVNPDVLALKPPDKKARH